MFSLLIAAGRALVKDDTMRAYLLAYVRHLLGAAGATLVMRGYASTDMVEAAIGFVCAAISFAAAHNDVAGVARKLAQSPVAAAPAVDSEIDRRLSGGTL